VPVELIQVKQTSQPLRVFKNSVLRRIFGDLRRRKWQEAGEDCIMKSFIPCTLQILLG